MTRAPVAFMIFNRPDETARVFERIRQARPRTLLVIADGPRNDAEHDLCECTRSVVQNVDWDCDVRVNASATNLGCRKRVSSGIDWVFNEVNEAIILEDDCLPDPTFFRFCDEMLDQYRDDPRVMHVGGSNFQLGVRPTKDSYYFSAINQIWGWATWDRAWRGHYDVSMKRWPEMRDTSFLQDLIGEAVAEKVSRGFDGVHSGKIDTWDNQWTFAMWLAQGLAILPAVNLISNIGFGANATHTKKATSAIANQSTEPMEFPLKHPVQVARNRAADDQAYLNMILSKAM
ncbi:MAG: glycosyltransferase family 2 protein [Anaerolineae bacterium]|nr:glycosyltransferase family 2 protein [Phycisphaerae bacterium]